MDRCIPSGRNLICINRMRPVSITVMHTLLTAPLPNRARTGQCPSPARAQCLLSPGQILSVSQTVKNGGEQTTTELKNAPLLPTSKRGNKKTDEEKQCKKKQLDRVKYQSLLSEVEGAVGFVRTQEPCRVSGFSAGEVRTPA